MKRRSRRRSTYFIWAYIPWWRRHLGTLVIIGLLVVAVAVVGLYERLR